MAQRWEYRTVIVAPGGKPRQLDVTEYWATEDYPDLMAQAGADGWELVQADEVHRARRGLIFKRPVEG